MRVREVKNISQVKSDIHYIKRFLCNVIFEDSFGRVHDFYVGFTMEHKPFGPPDIHLKYVDSPDTEILLGERLLKKYLIDMDKAGQLIETEEELFET